MRATVAGLGVTLLAYAECANVDLMKATEDEMTRVEAVSVEKLRARHAAKVRAGTAIGDGTPGNEP